MRDIKSSTRFSVGKAGFKNAGSFLVSCARIGALANSDVTATTISLDKRLVPRLEYIVFLLSGQNPSKRSRIKQ
jgi:hypothetical protein